MDFSLKRKAHLRLGRRGETLSCALLERKGMEVLARNFRTSFGELDIVARDGRYLVFIEVKTLRRIGRYRPVDNYKKQQMRRNIRAAHEYIRLINGGRFQVRYDFIEVVLPKFGFMEIYHYTNFIHNASMREY
ncbi:MAG: YraN family protein [Lentisphaeria bacterium]|nr:YraN family protein [Lentisphaeria bacterium]